jgi:kinesin family protein C2/C3
MLEQEILERDKKLETIQRQNEKLSEDLRFYKEKYLKSEAEIAKMSKEVDSLRESLKHFEDQKRELEHLNDQWESSNRVLEYSKQDLEEKLYLAEESVIMYREELGEITSLKELELQRLRDEIKELKQDLLVAINAHSDAQRIHDLESSLNLAMEEMNELRMANESVDNNCTVKVLVKIRPVLELDASKFIALTSNAGEITVVGLKEKKTLKTFKFEKVFGVGDDVVEIFEELKTGIAHFESGGTSCVLCYGQTGSGKTFTMTALMDKFIQFLPGILPKSLKISIHVIEVYNEQVRDLVSDSQWSRNWKNIINISKKTLTDSWTTEAKEILSSCFSRRCTKSTECNESSSRSHCIYTFTAESSTSCGIMQFVDLAGSERMSKSGVVGDSLKETLHINKSLSALQDVISSLESKSSHVPYRNSLLTRLLKPSLSGLTSKVTVILNVSPTEDNLNESLSTLSLGIRLKSVDLAWAIRKNVKNEEVERTLTLLEKERNEKNALSRKAEKLERDNSGYAAALKEKEAKVVFLNNKLKNIEKVHLEEIETVRKELGILKNRIQESDKKIRTLQNQAEQEKLAKNKALLQLKNRSEQIKRVMSADPYVNKKQESKGFTKTQTPSRIPKPGSASCNTSKLIIRS